MRFNKKVMIICEEAEEGGRGKCSKEDESNEEAGKKMRERRHS